MRGNREPPLAAEALTAGPAAGSDLARQETGDQRAAPTAGEQEVLSTLLDHAPGGLAYLDVELRVLRANRRYADACGHAPETMAGHSHLDLFPHGPDRDVLEQVRGTGRPWTVQAWPVGSEGEFEGEEEYWDWAVTPVVHKSGEVEALVVSFTDATERERLAKRVRQTAQGLKSAQSRLAVQARELQVGSEELEISSEELRQQNEELLASQQALEVERRRYHDLFDLAPGGYVVTDPRGVIREANRAAAAMLGVPAARLAGKPLLVYVVDRRDFLVRLMRLNAKRDPMATWELELRPWRRERVPISAHVAAFYGVDGRPEGLRWLLQAISSVKRAEHEREAALEDLKRAHDELERRVEERTAELKQAVAALSDSEERFRQMAENISEVFWMLDVRNTRLLYVSPAFETLTGVSRQYLHANPASILDLVYPGDRERLLALAQGQVKDGYNEQLRIVRADGVRRWVHLRAFPVKSTQGEVYRLVGIAQDVTERVAAYELLEKRVARRTRELSTVLEISRHVALSVDLPSMLHFILDQLQQAVGCDSALIYELEDETLAAVAYHGAVTEGHILESRLPLITSPIRREAIARSRHVLLHGGPGGVLTDHEGNILEAVDPATRCWVAVPLSIQERVIGLLELSYSQADACGTRHVDLAAAFAGQAAAAIENARLHRQTRELAAMEERQRLARDLHDAVSQSLFSANLIAEVLPRLWDRNPEQARKSLAELHELNRGALAEMRSLLLELRPAALVEVNLDELLRLLGGVVTGRSRIPVHLDLQPPCRLPPNVQINLYRLAQEALHNVAKHSGARQVEVRLRCLAGAEHSGNGYGAETAAGANRVELTITDDGKGFDAARVAANSLGLDIMRERAAEIEAALTIDSEVGAGTRVTVVWPAEERSK